MDNVETEIIDSEQHVFIGKHGERLTVLKSQLMLETAKGILLINLRSVASFFCKKQGKFYKICFSSRSDADFADIKSVRSLLLLKAEDTQKLMSVLKSKEM